MIRKSTPELLQFYKEWLKWAESGGSDDHDVFNNGTGLCNNLERWLDLACDYPRNSVYHCEDLLHYQFKDAGLSCIYPFGEYAYDNAAELDTMHKDEKRLSWVKARIADVEEE